MTSPQPTAKSNNGWTPERRLKQSQAIREWQPWDKSTGPRTKRGKARSSQNAAGPHAIRGDRHAAIAAMILRVMKSAIAVDQAFGTHSRHSAVAPKSLNELMDVGVFFEKWTNKLMDLD